MGPMGKNVAPLIFEEQDGHRRPIGFVQLDDGGIVTGQFNIISSKHKDLSATIFRALTESKGEHSDNQKAEARTGSRST